MGSAEQKMLGEAIGHHQAGRLNQAEALYRTVLGREPANADALHMLGVLAHQVGNAAAALELIERSIQIRPNDAAFYSNYGEILRAVGRGADAVRALRRAVELGPRNVEVLGNFGVALLESGETSEAERVLRGAIELNSKSVKPHIHLSRLLRERGCGDEAVVEARRAVEAEGQSTSADALANLVITLVAAKRLEEAEQECRRALSRFADAFILHSALGTVTVQQGNHQAAAEAFARSTQLNPRYAPAHSGLGRAMNNLDRFEEAIGHYRRALELKPGEHSWHAGLAMAFHGAGCHREAAEHWRRALELLGSDSSEYLNQLAVSLEAMGELDEAMKVLRRAAEGATPASAHVHSNLAKRLAAAGEAEEAVLQLRRARDITPDDAAVHSNYLLTLHYLPSISARELFDEHAKWWEAHGAAPAPASREYSHDRDPSQRLRIGYVSPDFRAHSVADFLEPLLASHDRERFEIVCYSDVVKPDPYTLRMRGHADVWRDTARLSDGQLAETIRDDRVDILVDLAGHTAGNRLLVFARKPAPIQVTYLGYPDTTGLRTIDYRITDNEADPPAASDELYSERLVRLSRTFLCYREPEYDIELAPTPREVTFASFNNLAKVSPIVIKTWARILLACPDSRLMIKSAGLQDYARRRVLEKFAEHGIGLERLELVAWVPDLREHLRLYSRVSVALDTFPYNGTTTTCEALWMGVPVVTLSGDRHMSRVGRSLLKQVDLNELVTQSLDEYVQAGVRAGSGPLIARSELRERMRGSSLMDSAGVTRDLEAAYRAMWKK